MSATPSGRLWVITECYPRPQAPLHCAFAHRQLVGIRTAGWEVSVLVPNGWFPPVVWRLASAWRIAAEAHIPAGWEIEQIEVADLPVQNRVPSRLSRPPGVEARTTQALVEALRRRKVAKGRDVLMCQFALPFGRAVRDSAKLMGVSYVLYLRGDDVWLWPHRSAAQLVAFKEAVGDASLVVATSRSLVDEARRLCDGTLPPSAVLPNGVDLEEFRPPRSPQEALAERRAFGIGEHDTVVVCVADALLRKGWRELFDALAPLTGSGDRLLLIGACAMKQEEIDIQAEARGRAPLLNFKVLRELPRGRLGALYRAADIFCLPSHSEGLSNAVIEAMASGLPVITTGVGGHPEVISHGVDGLLVAPRDVPALREALEFLIHDSAMRGTLGAAARRRCERIGSSRKAGERLSALLNVVRTGTRLPLNLDLNPYSSESDVMRLPGDIAS